MLGATLVMLTLQASAQDRITAEAYISTYAQLAIDEMKRSGVPASITLAQGLLESSSGNSRLAREANNHFGIKCKKGWTGRTMNEDDDEAQECFRAYDSPEDSYRDHSDFLKNNTRYAFLFSLDPKDYKGWASGLKQAGYATDPNYPSKLVNNIEKYELHRYDEGIIPAAPVPSVVAKPSDTSAAAPNITYLFKKDEVFRFNKIPAVQLYDGQTMNTVAAQNNLLLRQLYKYNDLTESMTLAPGSYVYIKPKKRKGAEAYHIVQQNESMHYISQLYGIKLKHLYKKNLLEAGQQPAVGEVLNMRKKRDEPPRLYTGENQTEKVLPKEQHEETVVIAPTLSDTMPITTPQGGDKKPEVRSLPVHDMEPDTVVEEKPKQQPAVLNTEKVITEKPQKETYYHIVKTGETLYSISKQYKVSVEDLRKMNDLSGNELTVGSKLYVYKAAETDDSEEGFHVVAKGETLYGIATKHKTTVEVIRKLNGMKDSSISIGQKLKVK